MKRYVVTNKTAGSPRRANTTAFKPMIVPSKEETVAALKEELIGKVEAIQTKHLGLKLRTLTNQLIDVLIEIEREVA